MKQKIHPKYNKQITVTCACGNTFVTGSTEGELRVELCSKCHPFYTGKQKLVDTAGRVDKFKVRLQKKSAMKKAAKKPDVKAKKSTSKDSKKAALAKRTKAAASKNKSKA